MKLSDICILQENANATEVKLWMSTHYAKKYELHPDGTVTIGDAQSTKFSLRGANEPSTLPFLGIRDAAGGMLISCYNNSSSRLDKFIQRFSDGRLDIVLYAPSPLLSLGRIKGIGPIYISLNFPNADRTATTVRLLMQGIENMRNGTADLFEVQQQWIDAGLGAYAKL